MKYTDLTYNENWQEWKEIVLKQSKKDDLLFPQMMRWFNKGKILELGSGIGQLSRRAIEAGYDVTPSDYELKFVEHMQQNGLKAIQVDARSIENSTNGQQWSTIFSQGASPFVTRDFTVVADVYRSVYENLEPGGRLVLLIARSRQRARFSRIGEHEAIARDTGFSELARFRNQALPSSLYRLPGVSVVEAVGGKLWGNRDVAVYEKKS